MIADSRPIETSPADTNHVAIARNTVARSEMLRPSPRADDATASTPTWRPHHRSTTRPMTAATNTLTVTMTNTTARDR